MGRELGASHLVHARRDTALDGALWFENDAGQEMCGACMVGVRPDLFAAAAGGAAGGGGGRAARDGRKRPRPAAEEGEGEEDNLFRGG